MLLDFTDGNKGFAGVTAKRWNRNNGAAVATLEDGTTDFEEAEGKDSVVAGARASGAVWKVAGAAAGCGCLARAICAT